MDKKPEADLSYLREMTMGDVSAIIETTEAFLTETPATLDNLQDYHDRQEWEKIAKEAHRIKPNLTYMGMDGARSLIIEIEEEVKSGDISAGFGLKLKDFNKVCRRALQELTVKIERLKAEQKAT